MTASIGLAGYLVGSPVVWVLICAVFTGAALASATVIPARRPNPEKAATNKWIFFCVWMSLAIAAALAGTFLPGSEHIRSITYLYLYAGATVLFAGVFRFRKSVGIAAGALVIAAVVLGALFAQSITAFTGETEIARVTVYSANESGMDLEVTPTGSVPVHMALDGNYFAPIVRVIIFDDLWVFLGGRSWYRFEGMTSFRVERVEGETQVQQTATSSMFRTPTGISERLYMAFERNEANLPGVRSVQTEIILKRVEASAGRKFEQSVSDLETYSVRLQNDGGIQIVAVRE